MAGLTLNDLKKVYPGGVEAVSGVSIDIADGEFVVLVGPSGCGKSTILRMIAGLESITAGDLTIGDRRVNELEPGERDIAMVFQNYALYPHMTVRRNMAYGLKNEGLPKAEIEARIDEAARTLQLQDYLDRKPRQLSGGQRQRVAMGRSIVRKPAVFLFDEPLSNLDAKLRTQLRAELKDLHRRLSGTFVFVTHDQVEAMSLADRIMIMNDGRVEQIGAPLDVYRTPQTTFVAEFIGNPSMNFFDVEASDGGVTLPGGERMSLDRSVPAGRVTLGLRPEHLTVTATEGAPLQAEIAYREQLGADTIIHARLVADGSMVRARLAGTETVADGAAIGLVPTAGAGHLFNPDTGVRM